MLKVYNTLTRKKEEFVPLEPGKVKMYVCGLTVQNYSHLGHTRSAVNYDVIKRYLEYKGYQVEHIQNFTDINEKIIARAEEEGLQPMELAAKYARAYLEDISQLNVKRADVYCSATENIDEIKEIIERLIARGFAYQADGNVYFSVTKFQDYGKLSGRSLEEMQAGARVEVMEDKRHPMDFALWKKVDDDLISWDSSWGKGWPGWHIECSAMSIKYLGEQIDIHGGGSDLIFPHHENEIAQSEACTGAKPFVKYWLHNGTVNLQGEKMSKSLGNFFTTRELLKKYSADEIRYFLLTKHYRSPIDFSLEQLEKAQVSLNKLINTRSNLEKMLEQTVEQGQKKNFAHEEFIDILKTRRQEFEDAMDDDFNSALAIGVLHEFSRDINGFINNPELKLNETVKLLIKEALNLFTRLSGILGLSMEETGYKNDFSGLASNLIDYILKLRTEAREQKDWQLADKIRDDLAELGIEIKDTPRGAEWVIREKG